MKNIIKLIAVLALFGTTSVSARDYISIVGSSTVYPFATLVAEKNGISRNESTCN